ncbi:MAG: sulfotransferase [Gammaproteobacteria bacterium]
MPSANQPILITGCQRSGTTLLHLILDSHSNIHGIDEAYYEHERLHEYLDSAEFSKYVCCKLPRAASEFEFIKLLPDVLETPAMWSYP